MQESVETMPLIVHVLFLEHGWTPKATWVRAGERCYSAWRSPIERFTPDKLGYHIDAILYRPALAPPDFWGCKVRLVGEGGSMDGCILGRSEPRAQTHEAAFQEAVNAASTTLAALLVCIAPPEPLCRP